MENDSVAAGRGLLLLVFLGSVVGAASQASAAPPLGVSPLKPFGAQAADASSPAAEAPSSGLPPLPLFAQAKDTPPTVPFATPPPGSIVEDDEESAADKEKREKEKKEKRIECNTDAQCPEKAVCASHVCKSVAPMTSGILYFHRPGPIGFRMVVPFYFHFWHPQHTTRILAPFFVDQHDRETKTHDLWVFPTYQYRRSPTEVTHNIWPFFFYSNYGKEGRSVGLLPLFWSSHHGSVSTEAIVPLLFFERTDTKEREHDLLFLPALLYLRQRQDETLGLFLGLGYYRKTPEKVNAGYFPFVFYQATATEHKTAVLPLFFEGGNTETGTRYATLIPFFFYQKNADKSRLLLTLLGGTYHDDAAQEDTTVLLVPPLISRDTPVSNLTVVPPIAAWWHNKQSGHRFGYIGPIFYSRDDEGGSEGLFPLYLRFESTVGHSRTLIFPPLLAALHRSPTFNVGFMGPLYGWSRPAEHSYGGGLLPLLSFASGPRSHLAVLPPLLIYSADRTTGRYHFSLGPIFYRTTTRGPDAGYDAGLFPLLFVSRHGARHTEAFLPLFYHHKEPYQEQLVLGPFYYNRACPQFFGDHRAKVEGGIVPFLFWKRSAEHSYTVLFPLFFEVHTPRSSTWMAGPIFYRRQKLEGDEGERTTFGMFPLFYGQRSKKESFLVGPLFGYRRTPERNTLVVGPYFETVSSPGKPEQTVSRALFPIFYSHCSPERQATVVFPLFLQVREEKTVIRSVLLAYWGVTSGETRAHALIPLFLSVRAPGRSTTAIGPVFYHHNDKTGSVAGGILPLFGYARDPERTMFITPLGFYHHDNIHDRTRAGFLTFYADVQRNKEDYGVFPLLFYARRGTATAAFALPFFYHSSDTTEDRSFSVVGPLFFGHKEKATYGGLLPLFYGKNGGDGSYSFFVMPLVYAAHRPGATGGNTIYTPLFGFSTQPDGYRFYVGPLYFRRDAEQRSVGLLPIFYDGKNLKTEERITMVLPLFLRRATPDKSLTMVTPLFWHQRTLTQRVTLLFPLFLDVNNVFRERTTAFGPVVPLIIRLRDDTLDKTTWLFPPLLTYVKSEPGHFTFVTFPIIWHMKSADRQTTVLFPLVFYLQRPATKTIVVLPLFGYRRDEHDNRSFAIIPLLTWWRNGSDGSRERVFFPLFWHFKSADRQTTVLFPLVWHARRPNYTVTVFLPFGAHWKTDRGSSTLVLNTYYYKGSGEYQGAWSFHFWPIFSFGRPAAGDLEWTILSGFIGYSRQGLNRNLRLLWGINVALEPVGTKTSWYGASWRMASDGSY